MRRSAILLLSALSAASLATPATAQVRDASIVSAGSEEALRWGKTLITRPFGAELVDRLAIADTDRQRDRTFVLLRGDVGGPCPSRYVLVTREGGGDPRVSDSFGTCSRDARLRLVRSTPEVSMPATAMGGPAVRYRYDDGRIALIDAQPAAMAGTGAAAGYGPRAPADCRVASRTDPVTQQSVIADFERTYPAQYRRLGQLKRTEIAPDELRNTVVGLACLATWPGAEEVVPRTATPLFASKRHGPAAFAALDAVAQDPRADANLRASVRAFSAEMLFRVDRREPL